jgi:hypothetical protein
MRFEQYLNEDVIAQAREILAQREADEKAFKESLNKIDVKKLARRIKFKSKEFGKDEDLQKVILTAIDIYEDVLKIPKNMRYKLVMVEFAGSTSQKGEGQVYVSGKNVEMELVRSVFGIGKSAKAYFSVLEVLAHEMIHVEQHAVRGEVHKREDYKKLPWEKRPWEIDAQKRENQVFRQFLTRANNIYLGRGMKIENGKIMVLKKGKKTDFDLKKHYKALHDQVPELRFSDLDHLEYEMEWKVM